MCGRFVQRYTWDDIRELYDLPDGPARNLQAHYNIAPTEVVSRLRQHRRTRLDALGARSMVVNKPLKQLPASFNARAETVADKAHVSRRVQTTSVYHPRERLYEWLKRPDGKQPYFISGSDGGVLSFAGLWINGRIRRPASRDFVHDHRYGRQRADAADSRSHAGGAPIRRISGRAER